MTTTRILDQHNKIWNWRESLRATLDKYLPWRKRPPAEEQIEVQDELLRLQSLMMNTPNMVAIYQDDEIVYINPAGAIFLGASDTEEIIGRSIGEFLLNNADNVASAWVRHHGEGFSLRTSEQIRRRDGMLLQVDVTAMPIRYRGGIATQIIVLDRTMTSRLTEQLKASEERYQTIATLTADYTYRLTFSRSARQFLFEQVDEGFTRLTGYTPDEAATWSSSTHLLHPDDLPIIQQHFNTILEREIKISEYRIILKSGEIRWVRDYGRPLMDENEESVIGIAGVIQDVTKRLQAELSLKTHALQQAVVAELGQHALNRRADSNSIIEEAVMLTAQVLDVEYCQLMELTEEGTGLMIRASQGWNEADLRKSTRLDPESAAYHATYTLSENESTIIDHLPMDSRFKNARALQEQGIMSGVCVIIHGQSQPIGVLQAHTTTPRKFTLDDVNFMQSVANVLAAYTEHQRTQSAEHEQRMLAEALHDISAALNSTLELDEVMDRMLAHLSRVVPHDAASIMLIDGEVAHIIRHAGFEKFGTAPTDITDVKIRVKDNNVVERMIYERKPMVVYNVDAFPGWHKVESTTWIRSYIGAPILFEDEAVGIINVDSATLGAFTENHARRLQAFCDQASIAIRNARRALELEHRVQERTLELDVERARLQTILDSSAEGIFYTEGLYFQYANQAFCEMVGYTLDELIGINTVILQGTPDLDEIQQHGWEYMQSVLRKGEPFRSETIYYRKDGTTFQAGFTVSYAGETSDDTLRTVTVVRDISREKELEDQKRRFIANASHELRNPIANLNTRIYMLKKDPDRFNDHIRLLEQVVYRMTSLVEDLLDMSRFENGVISLRPRDVIVQNLVMDVVTVQQSEAENKQIQLTYLMPDDPITAHLDPERIIQVITNLVSNAINYTPERGSIQVSLKTGTHPERLNNCVVLEVRDTGVGISAEDLSNIFQPFYRVTDRVKGTGLGLSISREIVALHQGDILVESVIGEGSTFQVYLPM